MKWLLLDAGNSAVKWALAGPEGPDPSARGSVAVEAGLARNLAAALGPTLASLPSGAASALHAIGCSVVSDATTETITKAVAPLTAARPLWLQAEARFEFAAVTLVNSYREPGQLGPDRWYAMIAARQSFPGRPLVVACAGTALTVDSVDADGRFLGGVIAPGRALMADSLARGTARLPASAGQVVEMPDNTFDAIATGVADAIAGLIERRARALARLRALPQLVLAGGGAQDLASRLRVSDAVAGIAVEEHLVLRGLWLRAESIR